MIETLLYEEKAGFGTQMKWLFGIFVRPRKFVGEIVKQGKGKWLLPLFVLSITAILYVMVSARFQVHVLPIKGDEKNMNSGEHVLKYPMDDVQSKGFWSGYVKNARKGGGYYWVYATVLRSTDANGSIKYVSIRVKPSREDIKKAQELYATLD